MASASLHDLAARTRLLVESGEWRQALELLDVDATAASPELLEIRADAAYGAGNLEACIESWEDAHRLLDDRGDTAGAARAASMVALHLMIDTGLMAPVRGWLRRAERHLAGTGEHPVRAIIEMVRAYERFMCGAMDEARLHADAAVDLGGRLDVMPAVVVGRTCIARLTILGGEVEAGVELLEEVGALLMSGVVDPLTTGMMYCEIICAAQGLLMPELAAQWTEVMERWRHGAAVGGINGRCRVHRAEVMRMRGTCSQAEAEAASACDELRPWMRREFGWPLVELGNVRLRAGDLDGAEAVFLQAAALSWSPQPGLALVHLARGEPDVASTMIADAIDHPIDIPSKERPPFGPLRLAPLYDAQAEIAHARGDLPTLARASESLASVAARYPSSMLRALARLARGRLALLAGEPERSLDDAGAAVAALHALDAPFEAAAARLVVAEAYDRSGRPDRATIERRAARAALESFGSTWWAARVPVAGDEPPAGPSEPSELHGVFHRHDDMRTVGIGGSEVVVRDLTGLRHLERLLAAAGREIHAVELVGLERGSPVPTHADRGLPVLDDAAKAAYRRRLAEVDEDIAAARADNDIGRLHLAEHDREFLVAELTRAVGLGGRDRSVLGDAERARVSVARSIRYALDRLAAPSPIVAAHLRQHVRTGTFCAYEPDALHPVTWTL